MEASPWCTVPSTRLLLPVSISILVNDNSPVGSLFTIACVAVWLGLTSTLYVSVFNK